MRKYIVERAKPQMVHAHCRLQTHTHKIRNSLLFHGDNGFLTAPHFYVTRTVLVLIEFPTPSIRCQIVFPTSGHTDCIEVYFLTVDFDSL